MMRMLLFYMALIEAEEDKLTFEHIFTQYPKQMHKVAFRILKNEYSAEDAVQEAVPIPLFLSRSSGQSPGNG